MGLENTSTLHERVAQTSVSPTHGLTGVLYDRLTEEKNPMLGSWMIQPASDLGHFSVRAMGS